MKLSAPKTSTFWIAVVLAVLGVLGKMHVVAALGTYSFALVGIAFLILALGVMVKGL